MGRLTYSARKIGGVKAGQTVSKDLRKRVPPGTGAKAAARDPTLEIDLTGKALTDDGFAQFIDDLLACIVYRSDEHPIGLAKVTEFHLQGNSLTVLSLVKLGEVVAHSAGDLRELDLSHNDIRVTSVQEKAVWKAFLECFKNCYVLTKLDLSNNPIGPVGLEIFACVYVKSDIDFLEADAAAIVGMTADKESALSEEVGSMSANENISPRANRAKKTLGKNKATKQNGSSQPTAVAGKSITVSDLKKFACTRGLRAIPYLILSNLELTTRSAIHISHMLTIQRSSEQLLNFLPPVKASAIPESAENNKCIIWQPNNSLPDFAQSLLEITESVREFKLRAESEIDAPSDDEDTQRRAQSKMMLDYTRLTKRVRLDSLRLEGVACSDIAITALKMMVVARALLLEDKDRPVVNTIEETARTEEAQEEEPEQEPEVQEEVIFHPAPAAGCPPSTFFTFEPPFSLGPFDRASAGFDEDFPALMKPTPRKLHPIQEESEQELRDSEESARPSPSTSPSPNQTGRSGKNNRHNRGRKQEWRFGLPFDIWRSIIADAVGADGILDVEQQSRIVQYASDWNVVAYGQGIIGVVAHQQIWKFLETVGCFTYSPLS
ncbi:hypothetical protein BJX64DRAFT_295280 [Aspergillus heterothallicus]